jgi:hypothetical protein
VAREASAAEAARVSAKAEAQAARAAADAAAEAAYLDAVAEKAARLAELSRQAPAAPASAWDDEDVEDAPDSWDCAGGEEALDSSLSVADQLPLEAPGPAEPQPQPVAAVEAQHFGWAGEFERGDTFVARAAAQADRSIVSAWDEE